VLVPNGNALALAACYLGTADNDDYNVLGATFGAPGYGIGSQNVSAGGQYELEFTVAEIPFNLEDTADLELTKTCEADGEVALEGEPFECTIVVENPGPGLPRNVVVTDDVVTAATDFSIGTASFTFSNGFAGPPTDCTPTSLSGFSCELGTVPVGGSATITVEITPGEGGD
jgi:hypothetical protein